VAKPLQPETTRVVHLADLTGRLKLAPAAFADTGIVPIFDSTASTDDHCVFIALSRDAVKPNPSAGLTYRLFYGTKILLSYKGTIHSMTRTIHLLIKNPETINREIRIIISSMFPGSDLSDYEQTFRDVQNLFGGREKGFHCCDTCYHDWNHTLGVLLATARLLHGVHLDRQELSPRIVHLALFAALFHDSGYIRRDGETGCTGARFTATHVDRGIDAMEEYATRRGWPMADVLDIESMIRCTDPRCSPRTVIHTNIETMLAAHTLATADIISQMADDLYLEKLSLLYAEFTEAGITDFPSEYDLATRTRGFHAFMRNKMENALSNIISCMPAHFRERHGIERDLYTEATLRNIRYLGLILDQHGSQYATGLRRSLDRKEHPVAA
jgi:hypothetical protein